MIIQYKTKDLQDLCTNHSIAQKKLGKNQSIKLQLRIDQIKAASDVSELIINKIGHCHALLGDRKGQYAIDLDQPYRLIFTETKTEITIAEIQEIVDYH